MAFTTRNLSVLAYAQGFTLWHYKAPGGRIEEIAAEDYFEPAGDMVAEGDMMMVSAADGGRILRAAPVWGRMRMAPLM